MNLYRNGQFVETFNDARDYDLLVQYLTKHAEPTAPLAPHHAENEVVDEPIATGDQAKIYNPDGTVLSLGSTNFQSIINEGHVFVKYFAPWCASPRYFCRLPTYPV